jgi:KamA family protein
VQTADNIKFKIYSLNNFKELPQIQKLPKEMIFDMEVVGNVLPFRANNYVIDQLINWENVPNDPIFILTFPQKDMLLPKHYRKMAKTLKETSDKETIKKIANEIRMELNPHPAGQLEHNIPELENEKLVGMQHKYDQTVLFFPTQGQTCHAYCTFCFRWAQFVGIDDLKFATKEAEKLVTYVEAEKSVTDILFTGGDPMIMRTKNLRAYFNVILNAKKEGRLNHLQTIRIGSKALSYWPYRFTSDFDAEELLNTFKELHYNGLQVAFMAHFNHINEMKTNILTEAVKKLLDANVVIRTQSPLLENINTDSKMWTEMWQYQVKLGMIPYYMFIARNTGAQHYFNVPIYDAWKIFHNAYKNLSGIARTVRGPSMSASPGKIQVLGTSFVENKKVFVLQFLQGRNSEWVTRPFFAKFDPDAVWLDDLEPVFSDEFFWESEYNRLVKVSV